MDSSSESDDLWNPVRDLHDPINDYRRDKAWQDLHSAFKQLEKDKLTKKDASILKNLISKKFKEDDDQSQSWSSEGFTDVEKSRRVKEHDLSSAEFIHADEPVHKKWKKKKKRLAEVTPW